MIKRRYCSMLLLVIVFCFFGTNLMASDVLPTGKLKPALEVKYFPGRLHTFVWRNWEFYSLERMAKVVGATPKNIRKIGRSMGLPAHEEPLVEYEKLGYITTIRRNWHLLPYDQLLTLLGLDAEKLAFTLQEEDFLWNKLGRLKPVCQPLVYIEPDEAARERCAEIKKIVFAYFKDEFAMSSQPRFDFVRTLSEVDEEKPLPVQTNDKDEQIRFIHSYFAPYGDALIDNKLDPYPDGLLQKLSQRGINGVYLHTVLRQLAPGGIFPEFGEGHEIRLANLGKLVQRAKKYGIKIYLYMNEPRAMPGSFFKDREHLKGAKHWSLNNYSLCTSTPQVREWIIESLAFVFTQVPGLGGVFTISASENQTNCYYAHNASSCPRCSKRPAPEVIAEVNGAVAAGVWKGNPDAKVIFWDWGWPDGTVAGWGIKGFRWASGIINLLPENSYVMVYSELGVPINRGGIASEISEYSMTAVGPGPRAKRHWALAKKRGLKTMAKIQVNNTTELLSVPYLPVMNIVAQHCENLAKADVDGLMLSWSFGGYPSPNLELARLFAARPTPTVEQALRTVAEGRYGPNAVAEILEAWSKFSDAFTEYPHHIVYLYNGPTQKGPANPLYPDPTGYRASMVGFPYDDLGHWREGRGGARKELYPEEVLGSQFEKLSAGWKEGLAVFKKALEKIKTANHYENAVEDYRIAEAAYLHFKSVANQIRFIMARDRLLGSSATGNERKEKVSDIKAILANEIELAKRLFVLTREDSRIGFETSSQYYYLPLDLVETVINCEYILNDRLGPDGITRN